MRTIALFFSLVSLSAFGSPHTQATLQLVRTIPLSGVGNDTVEVLDMETGMRLQTISGCSEPQGLGFLPKQNRLFIANGGSDELKI